MHVASQPDARPANVYKTKKMASVRVARIHHVKPARIVKRMRRVVTASAACAIRTEQYVNGKRRIVMRRAPCLQIELPEDERVALLLEDYDFFVRDIAFFCDRLDALTQARGKETVLDWQTRSRNGEVASVVRELLVKHYDPVYLQSMKRNFEKYHHATVLRPKDHTLDAFQRLAKSLTAY